MNTIPEVEYDIFVGKRAHKYVPRFRRFDALGGSFVPTWHWPAFFFPFWWCLYRKLYGWALVVFILRIFPPVHLVLMAAGGMSGYYLYFMRAQACLERLHSRYPETMPMDELRELGGVNNWVVPAAFVVTAVLLAACILLCAFVYRYISSVHISLFQ